MQQVRRTVGAAVVHQNQLVRHSRGGKSIIHRAEQQRQRSFFVVAWHDNGKVHRKPPFRLITASDCTPSSKANLACCRNATSWENRGGYRFPAFDLASGCNGTCAWGSIPATMPQVKKRDLPPLFSHLPDFSFTNTLCRAPFLAAWIAPPNAKHFDALRCCRGFKHRRNAWLSA